jgi:diguanylate cyclase (GGDEF)-like protein/PAS domain S-box-containing protein
VAPAAAAQAEMPPLPPEMFSPLGMLALADLLPVLIAYIDRDMTYRFANALYKEWHGVAPEHMIGRSIGDVFGEGFMTARRAMIERCMAGETVQLDIDVSSGGTERVVHTVFIPHLRDGEVLGAYVLSDDVTAARRQEVWLRELAHTDSLTGLPNRRSYEHELTAAINRAKRLAQPIALMYLDIDRFKTINDTMGHANGDVVLKEFATRLKAIMRSTDGVFRLAGDEFTIIVENVRSRDECILLGQKIIDAMALPFDIGRTLWPVSASVGIAWSGDHDPAGKLLSLDADAALYKAKGAGRNCYMIMG